MQNLRHRLLDFGSTVFIIDIWHKWCSTNNSVFSIIITEKDNALFKVKDFRYRPAVGILNNLYRIEQ